MSPQGAWRTVRYHRTAVVTVTAVKRRWRQVRRGWMQRSGAAAKLNGPSRKAIAVIL